MKGGFLEVDDFWGSMAWDQWSSEIATRAAADEYPIVDIPRDHAIMQSLYDIKEVPQVPRTTAVSDDTGTSERGSDSPYVNFRGIQDTQGR